MTFSLTSGPAIVGAAAALALKDRWLRRTSGARAWMGALGAAAGALVGWTALATINAMLTTEGGAWFSVYLIFAVVASLISGAAPRAHLVDRDTNPRRGSTKRPREWCR